jgi:hypothetical protein
MKPKRGRKLLEWAKDFIIVYFLWVEQSLTNDDIWILEHIFPSPAQGWLSFFKHMTSLRTSAGF